MIESVALVVTLLSLSLAAQPVQWPSTLQIPSTNHALDSHVLSVHVQHSLFRNTLSGEDTLLWRVVDSTRFVSQSLYHSNIAGFETPKHFQQLRVPGYALWKKPWGKDIALGAQWRPQINYSQLNRRRAMSSRLDVGPIVSAAPLGVPLHGVLGLTGLGWNDQLGTRFDGRDFDGVQSNHGVFGSVRAGTLDQPLFTLVPLYARGEIEGRSLRGSSLITADAAALYIQPFNSRDTLFFYAADSSERGSTPELSAEDTGMRFWTPATKEFHSVTLAGGFRARERWGLVPGVSYGLAQRTSEYPAERMRERRNSIHSMLALLDADSSSFFFSYSGAIRLEIEHEDKLFSLDNNGKIFLISPDRLVLDTLRMNLNDYRGIRALMQHRVSRHLANGAGGDYSFVISRTTRRYPNEFSVGTVVTRNHGDNHALEQKHRLWFDLFKSERAEGAVSGEFLRSEQVFLKSAFSGNNEVTRNYRLGGRFSLVPLTFLSFTAEGKAQTVAQEYSFPTVRAFDYPSRSREFLGAIGTTLRSGPRHALTLKWEEFYGDNGFWFSTEYVDTQKITDSTILDKSAFYAIEQKLRIHTLDCLFSSSAERRYDFRLGVRTEWIDKRRYLDSSYRRVEGGVDLRLRPLAQVVATRGALLVKGELSPTVESSLRRKQVMTYWNASVGLGIGL